MPQVPNKVFSHFLRGYFDGDGCAYFGSYFSKGKNKLITNGSIRLTSGSKGFLESLKEKIKTELKITSGSLYSKRGGFDLAYSGMVVLELYRFMYSSVELPHLRRKRLVLERYVKHLRP